jgi:hypothetical protein
MKTTLEGPVSGVGSSYAWSGNNQVGEGKMTIVEVKTDELVAMNLHFSRPFKCNNDVRFTIEPSGNGFKVS